MIPYGPSPTGTSTIAVVTVLITETVFRPVLATKTLLPSALTAISLALDPAGRRMVSVTVRVTVSITDTRSDRLLTT